MTLNTRLEQLVNRAQRHLERMERNGWGYLADEWTDDLNAAFRSEDEREIEASATAILALPANRRTGDF